MALKCVLFDFDYTLADATEGIVACFQYGERALGRQPSPPEAIKATVGYSLEDMYEMLTGDSDPDNARLLSRHFLEMALTYMTPHTHTLPYTAAVLRQLHGMGLALGIVTSKRHGRIVEFLTQEGLADCISTIVGADNVTKIKPHPQGLLQAMDTLGMGVKDTVYVGDSTVDAMTAQAAGCRFIAVTTGATKPEAFTPYAPIAVLKDLAGLEEIVKGM